MGRTSKAIKHDQQNIHQYVGFLFYSTVGTCVVIGHDQFSGPLRFNAIFVAKIFRELSLSRSS